MTDLQVAPLADFILARIAEDVRRYEADRDERGYGWEHALRECSAKRKLVELHRPTEPEPCHCGEEHHPLPLAMCDECGSTTSGPDVDRSLPCQTLQILGAPYFEHPNYRDDWRPTHFQGEANDS